MTTKTLAGKVAIVTGGSRGIGAGIAQRLAAAGATVAITYNSSAERAETVTKSIGEAGGTAVALRVDAADREAVRAGVAEVVERFGRLDILVNNAGVTVVGPVESISEADYDRNLAVNLTAVFMASQEALRHLGDGGRIITIGSINADRIHFGGGSVYALTKAGVAGLTRALAREVSGRGITVNTVQPGPVDTDMNPADSPFAEITRPHIAVGRYGTAGEVGSLVTYLAGPDAAYISGATINVDGGFAA
ncbi:3-oxoacyl-ACP reductase FabG [Micromonospora musae]|uniref:3-oxoacyl-ACP reductase FabG n=1 Tax=Micromonospora musae TaxID=1894970 RepID=A0A3A9YI30_9ACTN|nr:3-oxoacyl-ACP reductase family protein [Micromonospora musae]RKN21088.1 3-oxoacyl-ACP reductase FabG [Micromonospora musae]RKN36569.1 3-oxoacyl-ACP reductase FabG [Micromonospora musae]